MGKAKDIVDEKKNVLIALVPEKLRHGQGGKSDAQSRARRLVHLAENHSHFRLRQILLIDHAGLAHFFVKVVAFARALAHACKHGNAAVLHRDVIDQLLDNDGFADAGAAERADFSAFRKRTDEIDDFYSSFQNRSLHVLLGEIRCLAMNRIAFREFNRAAIVNRIARDVKEAAEHAFAHWHSDRPACVGHAHATLQAFG